MKFNIKIYANNLNSDILYESTENFLDTLNYDLNAPRINAMIAPEVISIQDVSFNFDSDDDRMSSIYLDICFEASSSTKDKERLFTSLKNCVERQVNTINDWLASELVTSKIPKDCYIMFKDKRWFVEVSPEKTTLSVDYGALSFSAEDSEDSIRDTVDEIVDTMIYDQ